jgi:hypothetical protein
MTQLAYLKSEDKFLLKSFENGQPSETIFLDLYELKETPTDLLIVDKDIDLNGISSLLEDQKRFFPIIPSTDLNLDSENFEFADITTLSPILDSAKKKWCLANNLDEVETLFDRINYFKDLWVKDRNTALEEIWFFLKRNLGASEISIIFNDLEELTDAQIEKGQKPALVQSKLEGYKIPNFFKGTQKETELMKAYQEEITAAFEITEFSREKSELVATAKINLSPIIIMAKVDHISPLAMRLLKALFNGLQTS